MAGEISTGIGSGPWSGGIEPLKASYGKLMMWFFILSDALTFSGFLVAYGMIRFSHNGPWADPDKVFHAFPFMGHADLPLVFVGLMTFILIASSVTMVLAVEAGHRCEHGQKEARKEVEMYMLLTIIGGIAFLSCQAWEWTHLIHSGITIFGNNQGLPLTFGQLFFAITGFHGFHVTTGVVINIIVYLMTINGVFDRRGTYEMVEKVGLYWHFVDLVWVFVFTFFYLV